MQHSGRCIYNAQQNTSGYIHKMFVCSGFSFISSFRNHTQATSRYYIVLSNSGTSFGGVCCMTFLYPRSFSRKFKQELASTLTNTGRTFWYSSRSIFAVKIYLRVSQSAVILLIFLPYLM